MRTGIDIIGGDYSPGSAIEGSILSREEKPDDKQIVFFGNIETDKSCAKEGDLDLSPFEITLSEKWVQTTTHPLRCYYTGPEACMFYDQMLLIEEETDYSFSAGDKGVMQLDKIYFRNKNNTENPKASVFQITKEEEKENVFVKSNTVLVVCNGIFGNTVLIQAEVFNNIVSENNLCNIYIEMLNFENFGGTPVLGVQALLINGHGIYYA